MRNRALLIVFLLLCSTAATFACVSYLLRELWLFALALLAMLFVGGLWLPRTKPGTAAHASWLGIGMGAFIALIAFLGR